MLPNKNRSSSFAPLQNIRFQNLKSQSPHGIPASSAPYLVLMQPLPVFPCSIYPLREGRQHAPLLYNCDFSQFVYGLFFAPVKNIRSQTICKCLQPLCLCDGIRFQNMEYMQTNTNYPLHLCKNIRFQTKSMLILRPLFLCIFVKHKVPNPQITKSTWYSGFFCTVLSSGTVTPRFSMQYLPVMGRTATRPCSLF